MIRYFLQRFIWVFLVLFGILTVTFIFLKIQPEYPPQNLAELSVWLEKNRSDGYLIVSEIGRDSGENYKELQTAAINDVTKYTIWADYAKPDVNNPNRVLYVYTKVPIMVQYGRWLLHVLTEFDWGLSTRVSINKPVTEVLNQTFKYSVGVNLLVLIIEIPFGLALGVITAIKKDKLIDNIVSIVMMVFISLPSFVVIMLLMSWLGSTGLQTGVKLSLLPYQWAPDSAVLSQRILSYVIPVSAISLGSIAGLTRAVRGELSEGLTQDFVLLARTKGLSKRQAIFRHGFRNALTPILPGLIFSFAGLLSGSPIIERVYGIPGAGRLFLQAIQGSPDYNIIMYDTAFFGFIGLFIGILVDISYSFIDPRIRMGAKND
ncbi:MAG: ABC transporter permease [Acholeplasmatales bacterium]|nr:ABC transporter permease [Acholeplasmatales bacterium]